MLGTFDPSSREDDEEEHEGPQPVAARLVMRQENTHRVILNTVILKAQKFDQKSANSAIQILFTAIENGKPVNMLLKVCAYESIRMTMLIYRQMSETNARTFTSEVALIQREL
jgi:Ran-binding protein 3